MTRPVVLLVTFVAFPEGEPEGQLLVDACAAHGLDARWVVWDDPDVAWRDADAVAVRSTWDYETRREEFLAWAARVESVTHLVHGARAFTWNTDKSYLLDLAEAGLPVVPTVVAEDESELPAAIAEAGRAVVKPCVGAGGRGVVLFDLEPGGPEGLDESRLPPGPWVVQPLVESIRTTGETSVFVLGGEPVSEVVKLPGGDEIRVHEEYGGRTDPAPLGDEEAALARRCVAVAAELLGVPLPYARVDLVCDDDGTWLVSELEITEPGLYLDVLPGNAEPFAEALATVVSQRRS